MDVRAVVFDFFGTLTTARPPAEQTAARAEQAAALGVDPAAYDDLLGRTYVERFRGAAGDVTASMRWAAERLGARPGPERVERAARVRLATERRFATPRPEAVDVLGRLREHGLRIGVVSDCTAELPVTFPDLPLAPLVDAAVFSCVTGHVKPEPENYRACLATLGVDPAQAVYVGDGGSDELAGARRVGLHPVLLDVVAERGGVVYGRAAWDGPVIGALVEVEHLLDALAAG